MSKPIGGAQMQDRLLAIPLRCDSWCPGPPRSQLDGRVSGGMRRCRSLGALCKTADWKPGSEGKGRSDEP